MDRNKPGYMNFDDIADRLESGKLNAYDVVYTKDTHEVVFIKEDLSLIRMKCRLDVYPSVVVAEYYLNLNTDTYVGQIVGIEQGEWICLYNVNYADNKFIVRKVGVDEYGQLTNKPQINGVTLEGNKTTEQLGINIPTKFSQLYDDIGYVTFDHLIENYYSKSQTYSKSEVNTALAGKADTSDIPTDLADLQDDSTHRTVTDENIAAWNAKSNVVANPSETTGALNSIEIDGIAYAIAGSGGGAVHSVNGKTGDVELNASDVHALPDDTPLFSGDYNDLENKPTIPSALGDLTDDTYHRTVTDVEKTQWNAAEPNVQPDWNQTTTSADDYIKNKPANLVQDANYVHTDNNFTNANKTKLNDIEAGAEVNVQSDWNQTDNTTDDYIKNKPAIPDPQIQSDWNQTSGAAKDYIKNKPTLGSASALDVATSGDASSTQVVKGDDSRLSDARTPISHTHTLSEITDAGTAASKDSTSSVTTGSTDLVESGAVKTAIDNAISGAYKHAGTKTCAELISSLLIASNNGNVYNMTDSGTTTADFIEGAGIPIRAGDNVGVAKISDGVYKFDLLSGFIDTSNFITKSATSGLVKNDGSIDTTEYAPASSVPAAQIQSDWDQSDNTKLDYIKNKPALGSAAAKNVPSSGNAGNSEVVLGNDTRLTDARNAADVYSWAKAENKPSYTKSEVGLGNVDNTSDATKKSNFTGSIASGNTGFVTGGDAYTELAKKVDKVEGKGLSTNDYTTTEKNKLAGIASGAEVNVQSDWNQTTDTADDYIKNKPANLVQDASYVHTDNNYTSDEKTKLSGIAANAEVNQNAFSNVKVGSTTIASGEKTATLEFEAGSNITLTPDTANKKVVLAATDTTYSDATTSVHGLMSVADKTKLDGISTGANKVESSETNGNIKIDTVETQVYDDSEIQEVIDTSLTETDYANPLSLETMQAQHAKNTKVKIEPIQDLHGYDKPWVGGAGKNKLEITSITKTSGGITFTVVKDNANNITKINIKGLSTAETYYHLNDQSLENGEYEISGGAEAGKYFIYVNGNKIGGGQTSLAVTLTNTRFTVDSSLYTSYDVGIGVFNNVNLNTGYDLYPMIRLASESNTFAPYSNICPISGHDQINVLGCGVNLLNPQYRVDGTTTIKYYDGIGTGVKLKANTMYTLCIASDNTAPSGLYIKDFSTGTSLATSYSNRLVSYTPTEDVIVKAEAYYQNAPSETIANVKMQLVEYDYRTQYITYEESNNKTIVLPDTVYGGELDLESGELVVDRVKLTNFDATNITEGVDGDSNWLNIWFGFSSDLGILGSNSLTERHIHIQKDRSNYSGLWNFANITNQIHYYNTSIRIAAFYPKSNFADINAFKTYEASNRAEFVLSLATPTTIHLTPQQLYLLKNQNNLTTSQYTKLKVVYRNGIFSTLNPATETTDGLMSAMDKLKLDSIADDATKTESSTTNGNIKIDGTETQVYDDSEIKGELTTDTTTIEGNPINFTTLSAQTAKSTILSVEPIQDLHGYDSPWVGGAGKQLVDFSNPVVPTPYFTYTYIDGDLKIVATQNTTAYANIRFDGSNLKGKTFYVTQSWSASQNSVGYIQIQYKDANQQVKYIEYYKDPSATLAKTIPNDASNIEFIVYLKNGVSVESGTWVQYSDIMVSETPSQSYEPYENICPISGRTEIGILGCGKNLLDEIENGGFDSDGLNTSASIRVRSKNYISVVSGQSYAISALPTTSGKLVEVSISYYTKDDYVTPRENFTDWDNTSNKVITIPDGIKFIRLLLRYADNSNVTVDSFKEIQVEKNNQSTQYIAYQSSNDLTISLGQTVYGGTLDVENGVLAVDWGYETFNSNTGWETTNISHLFRTYASVNYKKKNRQRYANADEAISNLSQVYYENGGNAYAQTNGVSLYDTTTNLAYPILYANPNISTLEELGTFFTSNPLEVCYELETPITINLTPHTINLLKGVNNISTDGDKITLTYRNGKFATLDGAVPKMTFRGEDYTMGVDDIGLFLENLTKSTKTYIANPLLNFDGTVATYKKIMKQWFINNGVNIMDSTGITYLCERWYEITKQGWKGGTSFPAVGVSTGSTGTRFDDNVDMSVTPSTDTSANTDTYQGLPLFAITDCNWELDSDGNILITAIDGITDNFVRDDPTKFVGVMQQTGWVKKVDDASTQKYYYADDKDAYEDLVPLPEAIKLDGTVRSFVVHAKYMSGIVDSKMTCCSGVIPRRNISHDSLVTLPDNIGTQYSGGTSVDWSFLVWMQRIKYASLTSDGVLQGCCNYNYQYYVKVSETGVKRLILSSANGANLKVGSTVTFGAYAGNADRGQAATYSISGQDGAIITSIEDVTIDGTTYKAVYVDTTSTFDTVANGDATNGTTIVSTHHWISGTCDTVKGNDGSPVSATNGVYPAKLQGIEFMVGGYEVMADVIMNISGGYYNPYYARKSTDQATSITSSMVQSTLKCAQPSSDAWRYIQKHGFDGEIFYPVLTGTSSSEYMKDGFYENGTSTSTGTREWLGFGNLNNGSGNAGMSYLNGNNGLGNGRWNYVARHLVGDF